MTSNIFQFLLDFADTLGKMSSEIWKFLTNYITIGGVDVPVYALLGTGGVLGLILLNIIKSIVL